MANLAIKGHSKRGSEVIERLEMLGGINSHNLYGDESYAYYTIDSDKEIKGGIYVFGDEQLCHFTLEEFLEKFPYKVGDKVYYKPIPQINSVCISEIISMRWIDDSVVYYTSNCHEVYACDLQPYKEEAMEQIKIDIPKGYEFFGIDDDNKVVLTKKQFQYPKTYEECFNICFGNKHHIVQVLGLDGLGDNKDLFERFIKLKICRDAYWKIAGEQMGLSKPWESDFTNNDEERYGIYTLANKVEKDFCGVGDVNMILVFPTEEMRDAFFDNFKDLIEQCKELL